MAAIALFVGMPWAVFTGIAKVKAAGNGGGGGAQLRKSELEALIAGAVADATAPLVRRIESLEAIATDEDREARRLDAAVLADALERDLDADDEVGAVRHRARS